MYRVSSLAEWPFTICSTAYNRKQNVFSASLNKTFASFHIHYTVQLQMEEGRQRHQCVLFKDILSRI